VSRDFGSLARANTLGARGAFHGAQSARGPEPARPSARAPPAPAWDEGSKLSLEDAIAFASRGWGPRNRPQAGWDALTPTELKVVELVAEGLSNPQIAERLFISPRTVSTHLSHVFAKVGVSSRAELAVAATKRSV